MVFKVVDGVKKFYRSKVDNNTISPTQVSGAIADTNWEWGLDAKSMCTLLNASASSILKALAEFAGSDVSLPLTAAQIVARVNALIALREASDVEALTTPEASLHKYVTVGNLVALKANDAAATNGNDTQHFMTPASTVKAVKAIVSAGVETWTLGDSGANGNGIVIGSDGRWYLANPNGDPANKDPVVAANRPAHWRGPYASLSDLLSDFVGAGGVPNGWTIVDANCETGMIKLKKPDGTTCTLFTKELEGVSITAPTSAPARTTGLAASVTTPTNGTAPYTYHWTLPDGSTANTQNVTFTAPATAGNYTLKCVVTDANGMSVTKTQAITVQKVDEVLWSGSLAVNNPATATATLSKDATGFSKLKITTNPSNPNPIVYIDPAAVGGSVSIQYQSNGPEGGTVTLTSPTTVSISDQAGNGYPFILVEVKGIV